MKKYINKTYHPSGGGFVPFRTLTILLYKTNNLQIELYNRYFGFIY